MKCKYCDHSCVKAGVRKKKVQTYRCKQCRKYQQRDYHNRAYRLDTNQNVIRLLIEGIGIRGIARVLQISITTVIERIKRIAKSINKSYSYVKNGIYEIDELWTFVGKKSNEIWIMYAIERNSKQVIDFKVGSRTKANLREITGTTLRSSPQKVCTDGLNIYKNLLPAEVHHFKPMGTRHIERFNLNLRTHLKRLSRKTICFPSSQSHLSQGLCASERK